MFFERSKKEFRKSDFGRKPEKRYSTTADVSRGKVEGELSCQQGNGLVSMTAEDNAA